MGRTGRGCGGFLMAEAAEMLTQALFLGKKLPFREILVTLQLMTDSLSTGCR